MNNGFQIQKAPHQFTYAQHPAQEPGNFFTSLIPSAGGVGGSFAGAGIGTAIAPGIGTLVGALLGGAVGGGSGKVVENAVEGNKDLSQGVLGEAALNGILGAGPLRLAKAGIDTVRGVRAGTGLADAISGAGRNAVQPFIRNKVGTMIGDKGAQMEARAGGYGIGEKVPGSSPLGFNASGNINKNLQAEGIRAGSPESRLKAVEQRLSERGQQIDKMLSSNDVPLTDIQRKSLSSDYLNSIENQPGVTDAVRKSAMNLANNFSKQVTDARGLVDFRRGLDSQVIAFNRNPDAKMAADQLAARTFRDILSEHTNALVPGIKNANNSYHNLMQASEFLKGGAKAISDQSQAAGGGIFGRLVTNQTAQSAKSRLGSRLAARGEKMTNNTRNPFGVGAIAGRELPIQALGALGNQEASSMAMQNQSTPYATTDQNNITSPNSNMDGLYNNSGDVASQGIPPENLIAALAADPAHASETLSLYQALNQALTPKQPKLSATQQSTAARANNALNDIQMLQEAIDSGDINKTLIPFSGTAIGGNILGTTDIQSALYNIGDVILRSRTGAAAPAEEINKFVAGFLPRGGESKEAQMNKLARAFRELSGMVNPIAASGSGGTLSLEDALMANQ